MATKNMGARTHASGRPNAISTYGRAGMEVLDATGDTVKDAMDITSDVIIDAGYFINTIAYGFDEGKPVEYAGKAVQRFLVDVAGAMGAIRGSVAIGKARMAKVAADSAEEARMLRERTEKQYAGASAPE